MVGKYALMYTKTDTEIVWQKLNRTLHYLAFRLNPVGRHHNFFPKMAPTSVNPALGSTQPTENSSPTGCIQKPAIAQQRNIPRYRQRHTQLQQLIRIVVLSTS